MTSNTIQFIVKQQLCTQCGTCSKECPTLIIDGKEGIPKIKEGKEKNCIRCQHCLAICPAGAISIHGKQPENSVTLGNNIPSDIEMANLIKTRRSIRIFSQKEIDLKQINELLDTAAYAPSGHNKNQVLFSITETKKQTKHLKSMVYDAIKLAKEENRLPEAIAFFGNFQHLWENKGIDILFRNAPHVLIASAPENNSNGSTDCVIALSYFELLANTKGIGTLWNGFVKMVIDHLGEDIASQINIPKNHKIAYIMVFGQPTVKFARSIQSEGLNVNRIENS